MSGKIETLFLDLGGVVVNVHPERLLHRIVMEGSADPASVLDYFENSGIIEDYETGGMNSAEFHGKVCAAWDLAWSFEDFSRHWNCIVEADAAMQAWLPKARERCRLIAVTNTNALHLDFMRGQLGVLPPFHGVAASCELRCRKPGEQIYRAAIESAGCALGNILYIDDRSEFVEAARALGLQAQQSTSPAQTIARVEAAWADAR